MKVIQILVLVVLFTTNSFSQASEKRKTKQEFIKIVNEIDNIINKLILATPETTEWDNILSKMVPVLQKFTSLGADLKKYGIDEDPEIKKMFTQSKKQMDRLNTKIQNFKRIKEIGKLKVGDCINVRYIDHDENQQIAGFALYNSQMPDDLQITSNGYLFQCEVVKIMKKDVVVKVLIELGMHTINKRTGENYVKNQNQNRYQINQIVKISDYNLLYSCY